MNDKELMGEAYEEAQKAFDRGECPVGAVIVRNGFIVARAGNREVELHDPTAHAEILALREAGQLLLAKIGPIMEEECRGIFMRWLKETGRDFILQTEHF